MQEVFVQSPFKILRRLHVDGVNATTTNVSAITWRAVHETGAQTVVTGSLVVADAVSDSLQLDGRWVVDSVGYNLEHDVGAILAQPGVYTFEYTITPTGGAATTPPQVVQVRAKARAT